MTKSTSKASGEEAPKLAPNDLPYTGKEYLESLNDGRSLWINNEKVKDVASHPAFRNSTRMIARFYDSLHDPAVSDLLTVPRENGVGRTLRFFQPPRNAEEQVAARDAIVYWSRMNYGWMGRTPEYKGSLIGSLAAAGHIYGQYQPNADKWYDFACRKVPFINHSIINPPVDRQLNEASSDVLIQVEKETDKGIIVSGAKVVSTGAPLTHYTFVAHYYLTIKDKKFSPVFFANLNNPGIKIICRSSYEYGAAVTSTPFDAPLSSRLDENDSIVVFDKALIPWEDVLMYDADSANGFVARSGFLPRAVFHAAARFGVKLDFIAGLFIKAVEITGTKDYRGVQAAVGEVVGLRHMVWGLSDAMARVAEPWGKYVAPNTETMLAFRMLAGDAASRVRNLILKTIASGLIYLPSSAGDFSDPELRPLLDKFVRGSNGIGAEERVKTLKLLWDSVNSEFAARHELYENNYAGSNEQVRVDPYVIGTHSGRTAAMKAFADKCMGEYDLKGWTAPDLINPDNVSTVRRS